MQGSSVIAETWKNMYSSRGSGNYGQQSSYAAQTGYGQNVRSPLYFQFLHVYQWIDVLFDTLSSIFGCFDTPFPFCIQFLHVFSILTLSWYFIWHQYVDSCVLIRSPFYFQFLYAFRPKQLSWQFILHPIVDFWFCDRLSGLSFDLVSNHCG